MYTIQGDLKFHIEEQTDEYVRSRMPVTSGMLNPFGTVHAGAMVWLADVTATVLALGRAESDPGQPGFPLLVNLHISLLGNQGQGELWAEARFVRKGKRLMVVRTQITGKGGRLLAEMTTTHIPAS